MTKGSPTAFINLSEYFFFALFKTFAYTRPCKYNVINLLYGHRSRAAQDIQMNKNVDMTTGSPFKKIFLFSIPMAFGLMLQNLYSLGDSLIVSLSRGTNAVTGVNLTESLSFLILGFGSGIASGFGIVLSQYVGAKDEEKMRKSFATSILLTILISVVMTVITVLLARPLLLLLNTNAEFIDYSVKYITAIFAGFGFIMFYNLSAQILRALGDGTTPLIILIIAATLNILLDSLLFVTDWDVDWAGWATVISQAISAAVGFIIIYKKHPVLRLKKSDFALKPSFAWRHLSTGLPMGFQFTITAIGCMIQQRAWNSLNNNDYAKAQATGSKIDNVFNSLLMGSANAIAVYTGQNYGANDIERVKKGVNSALLVGGIYSVIAYASILPLCVPFSRLLLKGADEEVYSLIFRYTLTQSSFYYVLYILMMYRMCLQSLGHSGLTIFGGLTELVMRFLAATLLAANFGFPGACFSNPCAWLGGAVFFAICYFVVINKLDKQSKTGTVFK